jgi:pyrimidine-nucleoside phosphorylase
MGFKMNFLALLEAKRDGNSLSEFQIQEFVRCLVADELPEYQIAAFLMAIYFRGLNPGETRALTVAMRDSGEQLQFPEDPRPVVDKHSTGGVGDKVSLVLAPLLACLGFRVPMMAGRGLGITGGTLDKLESIAGFQTHRSRDQVIQQVQDIGCCICGQTDRMVPADRRLYALRDVTGTVPSIPLITASILSKKLSESLDALVLNVTCGRAAFMRDRVSARTLAQDMVRMASDCGVKTRALVTSMDVPLGKSAGNWLEILEVEACLRGNGPEDLRCLVVEMAAELLVLTGYEGSMEGARQRALRALVNGEALARWGKLLQAQGVDLEVYARQLRGGSTAAVVREYPADRSGTVIRCDALEIGECVRDMGGGRFKKADQPRLEVGVDRLAKPGEWVRSGDVLARVHANSVEACDQIWSELRRAIEIGDAAPAVQPMILERIG